MYIEKRNEINDRKKKFHFDNIYIDNPRFYESIILIQIGDLSCESGYVIGDHIQCCYEISYIVSGSGYYYCNGQPYRVNKGDVFLCLPGEHHDGKADITDPFRYFYVGFNFDTFHNEQDPFMHIRKMFDQRKNPVIRDKFGIQALFVNIFNELINLKDYASLVIKAYLHNIIILAYRNFYDSWVKDYKPQDNMNKAEQIVYEIVNYIDINLCGITELTQIANKLGYSYSHLSHVFSDEIGLTIKEYYNRKRFEKAIEWLKESEFSITQIAEKLQYQSIHSFSKAFHDKFGISPKEYQSVHNNHKKE